MDDRCKNVPIEPCCKDMGDILMLNDVRESILFDSNETLESGFRFMIWWKDGDCTPLRFCPSCGKPVQEHKRSTGVCTACKQPIQEGEHYVRLSQGQSIHMDCIAKCTMRDEE